MTRAEVITLAQIFCHDVGDEETLEVYYDEILEERAKDINPPLVDCELFDVTAGTSEYDLPNGAVCLLAFFRESRELRQANIRELSSWSSVWRTATGDPYAFTAEEQNARTFRLIPEPVSTTAAWNPLYDPLGEGFPTDGAAILYAEKRDVDIPDWLAIPVALDIAAREHSRPSDHQDTTLALHCDGLARALYRLLNFFNER